MCNAMNESSYVSRNWSGQVVQRVGQIHVSVIVSNIVIAHLTFLLSYYKGIIAISTSYKFCSILSSTIVSET